MTIIGNLTKDPELRTTTSGISVCSFTVAVNKTNRRQDPDSRPEADYFRVTVWRELGENCAKFLQKGKKVCVIGPVTVSTYAGNDGATRANLEVTATDVEFLSPRVSDPPVPKEPDYAVDTATGYQQIPEDDLDELPF